MEVRRGLSSMSLALEPSTPPLKGLFCWERPQQITRVLVCMGVSEIRVRSDYSACLSPRTIGSIRVRVWVPSMRMGG
eukprot:1354958-Amorphochlora_amoeboformis.AAC.1